MVVTLFTFSSVSQRLFMEVYLKLDTNNLQLAVLYKLVWLLYMSIKLQMHGVVLNKSREVLQFTQWSRLVTVLGVKCNRMKSA